MYVIRFSKQASKDKKLLKEARFDLKIKNMLDIIAQIPFQTPQPRKIRM